MRARLAVYVSGVPCELREIVLRDKAPEMLAVSPKGTVPVVVTTDGTVIEESLDVMLWALERHDPEGWLEPEEGDVDEMLELIAATERDFKPALDQYKYAAKGDDAARLAGRDRGADFLQGLEGTLSRKRYLFGDKAALADFAVFPFVRQFANVDRGWFDQGPWPALRRWLTEFLDSARFAAVMKKYPKWRPSDEPVTFP